jgi:iron complex outermembrane recepter protein
MHKFTRALSRRGALLVSASFLIPLALMTGVEPGYADDQGVETITVTATKRTENIQNVAASITAFSGDELEHANITNFSDLARLTPSLQIYNSINNRNTTISIRNFGTSGSNPGLEPDVGLFVDGVYTPALSSVLNDLADISTVEVLRGPQGTLYGRNTPVGDVNITTRAPTQEFEAMLDGEIGNYDEHRIMGYIGGGITDDLAGRISAWSDTHSGYVHDVYSGADVDSADNWGVRGRLRWTPDSETTVDFIGYYTKLTYVGYFQAPTDPYGEGGIIGLIGTPKASYGANSTFNIQTAWNSMYPSAPLKMVGNFQTDDANVGNFGYTQTDGASLQASRELPFGATLTDILAYNTEDDYATAPINGLPVDALPGDGSNTKWESASNELRVVSDGHHFLDYVAGVYFYYEDLNYLSPLTIGPGTTLTVGGQPFTPGQSNTFALRVTEDDVAPYAQVTANPLEGLRVTGGIRKSFDHKHGNGSSNDKEPDGTTCGPAVPAGEPNCTAIDAAIATYHYNKPLEEDPTTWMGSVQYDVTDRIMAYYTMGNGFKDGGFVGQKTEPLAAETSLNYELGVKSIFFDNKLLLNADIYRMFINDLQLSSLAPGGASFVYVNAGKIEQNGVEVETEVHPIDHLSVNGSLSYINAQYTDYPDGSCISGYPYSGAPIPAGSPQKNTSGPYTGACDLTGFTPNNSPKWKWSLSANWEQPWMNSPYDWFISGAVHSISSQNLTPTLDPRADQPGYTLFDANLGFEAESGKWKIQLYGRNLANQAYYQAITPGAVYAFYVVNGKSPNGYTGYWGQPRTFGIEASVKF